MYTPTVRGLSVDHQTPLLDNGHFISVSKASKLLPVIEILHMYLCMHNSRWCMRVSMVHVTVICIIYV